MNLREMLEELREGILHDKSDQLPGSDNSDYLWSDRTLVRYINEAQRKFCIDALILRDGTTNEVTRVQMTPYQNEYDLHPSVIAVLSVKCEGDRADLARAGHSSFDTYHMPDSYYFDPSQLSQLPPGKVVAYDTDEWVNQDDNGSFGVMNLRLYPKPSLNHVQLMKLRVIRKPLYKFSVENLDAVPEIPEEHHMDILDWAAYLALRKVDRDAEDTGRAENFKASYLQHVEEAKALSKRKTFTPMQWGFGRNGFSYETN
jgi:hypothetical protein